MFIIIIACLTCHTIMLCSNVILSSLEHSKQYCCIHLLLCLTLNLLAYAICKEPTPIRTSVTIFKETVCYKSGCVLSHLFSVHCSLETTFAVWLLYIAFGSSRRLYIIATVADNHIMIWYRHKYNVHLFRSVVSACDRLVGLSACRSVVWFGYYLSFLLCFDFRFAN